MTTNKPTEDVELTIRKMLNKLCHSNLGEVFQNFMRIQAQDDDLDHLTRLIVDIILNKVDINPGRAGAFVKLTSKCFYHKFNLRQEILDRCLVEFRSCMDNLESIDKSKLDRFKAKLIERSEGNIRLLGELFNYQVLNCKMIMECVDILFKRQDDLSVAIFCNLIRTIGHKLDKTVKEFKQSKIKCLPKLRDDTEFVHWIETLFEDLDARITSGYFLSLNSETAVQEVLQLRKNNWKTEEVVTTSKSRKNLNLQLAPRNIDNEASKDWVFAEFPKLMSGLVAEEDKTLDAMKAQPEKSRDTISPSSGESDVDVESIIRQMLNRVSHSNFDEVLPDFISIQADDIDHLASLVVDIMLSKLDRNPWRASVFARLISEWFRPKFDLRKGILKRCKAEFILCIKNMDMDAVRASGDNLEPIRQSELGRFKANIRLLGELYNYQALEDKKIMKYVDNLLKRHDGLSVTILCNLIRTIGRQLDKTVKEFTEEIKLTKLSFSKLDKKLKFVHGVENLFEDLRTRSNSEALSSSSITDLKEILQLRKNNWEREEASTTSLSSNKINWTLAYGVDLDLTIRQMLNKLSHSNFDEVFEEFSTSNCINGDDNLISLAVDIMMEKVAKKPTSAGVLAKLVSRSIDQFRTRTKRSPKLMKGILDQCQMKFQSCVDNLDKIKELEDNLESIDKSGLNILALELVKSNEGNIRLIGELCNHQMLIPRIIMECANVLLKNNHDMGVAILCDLIRTTGLTLDKKVKEIKENKSKKQSLSNLRNNMKLVQGVENFFEDLTTRSNGGYLPSNSITAVKGILELRKNNWKTEEGLTTSKLVVNGAVPIFKQRKIDNQIFVKLNNNVQSSSRMSTSSNSTSGALDEDDLVSKRFAELTGAMSSVKLTPYLATKKEEVFHSAKAKLEKSTDTISCSRGKSNTCDLTFNAGRAIGVADL
ncbi:Eukaryotic translation initiation factor 4 gamma 1 [Folsomia candida]|uniref:Eukaryotic translation initiation factor 4 gamma 1 n=1 Tax=Folsomia candida TaxID=158441 RepID=A0A226D438_FOLCA|nr:Eukaryotic translation initiation factor 4 gamma 1 [Folsomia candida]